MGATSKKQHVTAGGVGTRCIRCPHANGSGSWCGAAAEAGVSVGAVCELVCVCVCVSVCVSLVSMCGGERGPGAGRGRAPKERAGEGEGSGRRGTWRARNGGKREGRDHMDS